MESPVVMPKMPLYVGVWINGTSWVQRSSLTPTESPQFDLSFWFYQEQNFHATNEKLNPPTPPPLFLLQVGGKERVSLSKLSLLCRVDRPVFTFHLDSGQSTFHASFWEVGGFQSNLGTPDMFANSTSLLSHMLWQMLRKCCPLSGAKGEELCISKQRLLVQGASVVSVLSSVMGQ